MARQGHALRDGWLICSDRQQSHNNIFGGVSQPSWLAREDAIAQGQSGRFHKKRLPKGNNSKFYLQPTEETPSSKKLK